MKPKGKSDKKNKNVQEESYHIPVMLKEAVAALHIQPNGIYVDCTLGGGGHSREILKYLNQEGKLIAFDQDEDAASNVPVDPRFTFVPHNFRFIQRFLKLYDITKVDGVLADLGVSSHQFDEDSRGFSFRFDAPLDMRMDQRQEATAASIANSYAADELQQMLSMYGEVTNAKTLAQVIVAKRLHHPFSSIQDLMDVLTPLAKGNPNRYYAQVFQAFRIEVNQEIEALKEMLTQLPQVLNAGGKVAIITFHSLEDRIVKNFFKHGSFQTPTEDPVYGHRSESPFTVITKKPVEPSMAEIKQNPRARSARLRVAALK